MPGRNRASPVSSTPGTDAERRIVQLRHDYSPEAPGVFRALNDPANRLPLVHIQGTTLVAHRSASDQAAAHRGRVRWHHRGGRLFRVTAMETEMSDGQPGSVSAGWNKRCSPRKSVLE